VVFVDVVLVALVLGKLLGGRPADERLHGTAAATALAVAGGARLIRAHDVAATCDVVAVAEAIVRAGAPW